MPSNVLLATVVGYIITRHHFYESYHSENNSGEIKLIFKDFGVVYVLMAGLISKIE